MIKFVTRTLLKVIIINYYIYRCTTSSKNAGPGPKISLFRGFHLISRCHYYHECVIIVSTCTGSASLDTSSSNDSEFEDDCIEPRMYGMRICIHVDTFLLASSTGPPSVLNALHGRRVASRVYPFLVAVCIAKILDLTHIASKSDSPIFDYALRLGEGESLRRMLY